MGDRVGGRNVLNIQVLLISLYGLSHLELFYGASNQQNQVPRRNYVQMTFVKDAAKTGGGMDGNHSTSFHI